MFKLFRKLIKLVLYLAFVAAAVYYTPRILAKVLNTEYPLATITSGSMWPVLKENDLILVKGMEGSEAEIGQIIIFRNQKGFTIHRLIRRESSADGVASVRLVTMGDANDVEDSPITEGDVIGRVVYLRDKPFRIPKAGGFARILGPKIQDAIK